MRLSDCRADLTKQDSTFFVGGLYPRRHLTLLASAPGMGKTWLITKQAIEIAEKGSLFLGARDSYDLDMFPDSSDNGDNSLVFCGEAGAGVMAERIRAMGYASIPEGFHVYTQTDLFKNNVNICLDTEEGLSNFEAIVDGEGADLVFIDTLISFRGEDECDQKATSLMLGGLRRVAETHHCAIVLSHHLRKRKAREQNMPVTQDDIIGTGAFTRLASCAFTLSPVQFSDSVLFSCVKSWWRKPKPRVFSIKSDGHHVDLAEVNDSEDDSSFRGRCEDEIARILPNSTITISMLADRAGCSHDTARLAVKNAVEAGVLSLHWVQDNVKYFKKNS